MQVNADACRCTVEMYLYQTISQGRYLPLHGTSPVAIQGRSVGRACNWLHLAATVPAVVWELLWDGAGATGHDWARLGTTGRSGQELGALKQALGGLCLPPARCKATGGHSRDA